MNIYYAVCIGFLPAFIVNVVIFIKKKRGAVCLAVFCVTAAVLLASGLMHGSQEAQIPPDELLRLSRLHLGPEKQDRPSLPGGFLTADTAAYERIIKARPELAAELAAEKDDPVLAEFCRRLRSSVMSCSDRQAAYMTLAELEFILGHADAAEAAIGEAFSFVPEYKDAEPYFIGSGFARFAGDCISRRNTLFDTLASCPPDGSEFSLQSDLVYNTGVPVTLSLTGSLHGEKSFLLLKGRRSYMIEISDKSFILPADTESGEYTLILSDSTTAITSSHPFYVTSEFAEIAFGDYVFTACAASDGAAEGMATLGGWLHFNGSINVTEGKDAAKLEFQSAYVIFDESSPLYGGALIVTPESAARSENGSPFVFKAAVTAGDVRLTGVTVTLYGSRMELTQNGSGGVLPEAVSHMLSGKHVSAEIKSSIRDGRLFVPYRDTRPPVLEITSITEDGPYYIITGETEAGSLLAVNGKSIGAEQGGFSYKTAAADAVRIVITAEDRAGNRTLREIHLNKDKPQNTAFSFYSYAPFFIISAAAAVNSTAAAVFIADDRVRRLLALHRRRIFGTAAVFGITAAASFIANAVSESAKIASSAFFMTAKISPGITYEIIKGRDNSVATAIVLIILSLLFLAASVLKKRD